MVKEHILIIGLLLPSFAFLLAWFLSRLSRWFFETTELGMRVTIYFENSRIRKEDKEIEEIVKQIRHR